LLSSQLDLDFKYYVSSLPPIVVVMSVVTIVAVAAVPIVRPIVTVIPIWPIVGITVRIIVPIWIVSVVTWASEPN